MPILGPNQYGKAENRVVRITRDGATHHITCEIPTAELRTIEQQLPGLTRGEGSWMSSFAGYVPVSGDAPVRARIGPDPLNREYYLAEVARA